MALSLTVDMNPYSDVDWAAWMPLVFVAHSHPNGTHSRMAAASAFFAGLPEGFGAQGGSGYLRADKPDVYRYPFVPQFGTAAEWEAWSGITLDVAHGELAGDGEEHLVVIGHAARDYGTTLIGMAQAQRIAMVQGDGGLAILGHPNESTPPPYEGQDGSEVANSYILHLSDGGGAVGSGPALQRLTDHYFLGLMEDPGYQAWSCYDWASMDSDQPGLTDAHRASGYQIVWLRGLTFDLFMEACHAGSHFAVLDTREDKAVGQPPRIDSVDVVGSVITLTTPGATTVTWYAADQTVIGTGLSLDLSRIRTDRVRSVVARADFGGVGWVQTQPITTKVA